MELIVLDENFDIMGPVPLFRTLIWVRRYQQPGCFELHVSTDYFPLLNSGRYLYRNDAEEQYYGDFAESVMRQRVRTGAVCQHADCDHYS